MMMMLLVLQVFDDEYLTSIAVMQQDDSNELLITAPSSLSDLIETRIMKLNQVTHDHHYWMNNQTNNHLSDWNLD